ncbi:MAG: type II toxin-antitoxin system prevent-host-death family antitoxin [Actinobacteria bacterium]|nr:type II toxin-antitoxin system prevent-host-death family antitoxin [Actinomycetota bacterium]
MRLTIGIRELRQHASRYLRLVEERGEPIQITDRGRPVALLTPMPRTQSRIEQLRASGRIRPAKGSWRDLPPPLEPESGAPLPSEVLAEMREHER